MAKWGSSKWGTFKWGISGVMVAIITVTNYTRTRISNKATLDQSVVTFQADKVLDQWEARADGAGVGQGALVGSGGAVAADTDEQFNVDDEELSSGDKQYKITVYGHNGAGWSVYE